MHLATTCGTKTAMRACIRAPSISLSLPLSFSVFLCLSVVFLCFFSSRNAIGSASCVAKAKTTKNTNENSSNCERPKIPWEKKNNNDSALTSKQVQTWDSGLCLGQIEQRLPWLRIVAQRLVDGLFNFIQFLCHFAFDLFLLFFCLLCFNTLVDAVRRCTTYSCVEL